MEFLTTTFEQALSGSPVLAFLLVYLAGLATSFTPCVLPMLPVAVGVITASARKREFVDGRVVDTVTSRSRALLMGLFYALGLAAMFSILGLFAAISGKAVFGMLASSPWTYAVLAVIMLLLALWLLLGDRISPEGALMNWALTMDPASGAYTHSGPLARSLRWYSQTQGGGAAVTFAFGFLSGIIAGPCTAPVIAAVLAYIAGVGAVVYGVALMFVYALGLATLMVAAGVSATLSFRLSRKGRVAQVVKITFVSVMLLMVAYFGYQAASVAGWLAGDHGEVGAPMYRILDADPEGAAPPEVYQVGAIFPDFSFVRYVPPADDSQAEEAPKTKRFRDYRGKVLFITFWGSWCAACIEEIPEVKALQRHFADNPNVVILSVQVQDALKDAPGHIARLGITYPVLIDDQDKLCDERLSLMAYPYNMVIGPDGKIEMASGLLPKDTRERIAALIKN